MTRRSRSWAPSSRRDVRDRGRPVTLSDAGGLRRSYRAVEQEMSSGDLGLVRDLPVVLPEAVLRRTRGAVSQAFGQMLLRARHRVEPDPDGGGHHAPRSVRSQTVSRSSSGGSWESPAGSACSRRSLRRRISVRTPLRRTRRPRYGWRSACCCSQVRPRAGAPVRGPATRCRCPAGCRGRAPPGRGVSLPSSPRRCQPEEPAHEHQAAAVLAAAQREGQRGRSRSTPWYVARWRSPCCTGAVRERAMPPRADADGSPPRHTEASCSSGWWFHR
jgi:hypothetical protein